MSTKALLTAAATGAFLVGAGAAYGQGQGVAITELELIAEPPDYYAATPVATLDTAASPVYYATVAKPAEVYATLIPQIAGPTALAFMDGSAVQTAAVTAETADVSATAVEAAQAEAAAAAPTPTLEVVTSMPVPDTPQNRARYGQPLSRAGRLTAPLGN